MPADDLDPMALRQEKRRAAKADADDAEPEEPAWTATSFVEAFFTSEPKSPDTVLVEANERGLSDYAAAKLVRKAKVLGLIHPWDMGRNRTAYATVLQPEARPAEEEPDMSRREEVETMLRDSPDLATRDVAERCGVSTRYVQRIRRELGANKGGEHDG
jgi:hypothetical protein